MSFKKTVILAVGVFLMASGLALWGGASFAMNRHLNKLEAQLIEEDMERLRSTVEDVLSSQARMTYDYARWEDAGRFLKSPNDDFREANLTWSGLKNLGVHHFLFLDTAARLVEHFGADLDGKEGDSLPLPLSLMRCLDLQATRFQPVRDSSYGWIDAVGDSLFFLSASAVTMGEPGEQTLGYLVMARQLDSSLMAQLTQRIRMPLSITRSQGKPQSGPSLRIDYNPATPLSIGTLRLGQGQCLQAEIRRDRKLERTGRANFLILMAVLGFSVLLLALALLLFLQRRVLAPLLKVERSLAHITSSGNMALRVPLTGSEELRAHAGAINQMLSRLEEDEKAREELAQSLSRAQIYSARLVDYLPDSTFSVDAQGKVMAWNLAMANFSGEDGEAFIGQDLASVSLCLYGVRRPLLLESFFDVNLGDGDFPGRTLLENGSYHYEEFITHPGGHEGRFLEQTAISIRDDEGVFLGAIQTLRDVSEQRRAEKRLEYLSLHDTLTGFYNRTYYEEVSASFYSPSNLPLSALLMDLDGLKLVNDTLGHEHGDSLLLAAASLLRKALPGIPIARIGGDEFVALFARTSPDQAQTQVEALRALMDTFNAGDPPLQVQMSLGLGYSEGKFSLQAVVKEADEAMYRDKEQRRERVRASYVQGLQRRFEEFYRGEMDPLDKILSLAEGFALYLEFEPQEREQLSLLARYRDIGRVGMSGRLFLTPTDLDKNEQTEMRKQPEIGHRIARLSRELSPIADLILKHREWWNGKGYPLGLEGEQIPMLNRMLAVVEAFAVMTTPRFRRRTLTEAEATAELKLMSGQKLDPRLVEAFTAYLANRRT